MIKKIASIFMTAVCLLSFTACHGLPKPVSYYQNQDNEEAESLVQENRQAFIDKVAEVYGDSAALSDIECVRVFPEKYDAGYKSYHKELKGKLTIDGKSYEALYYCETGTMKDSVHTEAIMSELTDALPLDQSKILEIYYPESTGDWDYGEQWKFPYQIKTFDEAVTWGERADALIYIWIYTLEDISDLTEADFAQIPQMQKAIDSTSNCKITILSLTDTDAFEKLKGAMMKNSDNFDRLLYPDITDEKIANVFNEYHMTNMLKVGNDFDFFDERPHALYFQKVKEVKEVKE